MLVLNRKEGETLHIGDSVQVTILAVSGSQVKVGIAAPRSVEVVREELLCEPRVQERKIRR